MSLAILAEGSVIWTFTSTSLSMKRAESDGTCECSEAKFGQHVEETLTAEGSYKPRDEAFIALRERHLYKTS